MKYIPAALILVTILSASLVRAQAKRVSSAQSPNVVLIMADDLGFGDLRAYNAKSRIPTPNLDDLAADGIRFTDAHSPSAVCSPTRYALLTGRYCWRTRLKAWVLNGYSRALIEPDRSTIASMLRDEGYRTACVGKWHLGLGSYDTSTPNAKTDFALPLDAGPATAGFVESFIIPASLDMPPYVFVDGDRPIEAATDTTQGSKRRWAGGGGYWRGGPIAPAFEFEGVLPWIAGQSVSFIRRHVSEHQEQPFFLYVPLTAPHTPWVPTDEFQGRSGAGWYGDFVAQVDAVVGEIVESLIESGVHQDTLIIFTSDNGSHWRPQDIEEFEHRANGQYRGMKADVHEGGHRVPMVVRLPGGLSGGEVNSSLVGLNDVYATLAQLVGHEIGEREAEDSVSFLEGLTADDSHSSERSSLVHHSGNGMFALRVGDWKFIDGLGSGGFTAPRRAEPTADGPSGQLYNLATDPAETTNVYLEQPDTVARMTERLRAVQAGKRSESSESGGDH